MKTPGDTGEVPKGAQDYEWLADPAYLPNLSEVQEAQLTEEGREAIHGYYLPFLGLERFEIWTQEYIDELSNHIVRTMVESADMEGRSWKLGPKMGVWLAS